MTHSNHPLVLATLAKERRMLGGQPIELISGIVTKADDREIAVVTYSHMQQVEPGLKVRTIRIAIDAPGVSTSLIISMHFIKDGQPLVGG